MNSSKWLGALLSTGEKQMPFESSKGDCLPAFLLTFGASHSDNNGEHWSLVNTVLCSVKSLYPLTTENKINGKRNKTLPFSPAVISDSCIRQLLLERRINAKLKKFSDGVSWMSLPYVWGRMMYLRHFWVWTSALQYVTFIIAQSSRGHKLLNFYYCLRAVICKVLKLNSF